MNNNELMLDVGQANEIKLAMRREGPWTNEEIKMLCEQKGFLAQVREVLLGRAEIKPVEYLVDLDADPFVPAGWSVAKNDDGTPCHIKGGRFKYDSTKVKLYLSKRQQNGKAIVGNDLHKELNGQPVYNANLLDFYLKNPHLIPEKWEGKAVFFWGTIFRYSGDDLCVRYLYWYCGGWYWGCRWLGSEFDGGYPAAVSAS